MNKTHASPKVNLIFVCAFICLTLYAICAFPVSAYAAHTVNELNTKQAFGQSMVGMGRDSENCVVEYMNSAVTKKEFTKNGENYREFYIKHGKNEEVTKGGNGTVLLKIRRNKARTIDGREADCRISVTYVKFTAGSKGDYSKDNEKGPWGSYKDKTYVQFAHQASGSFWVGTRSKDGKGVVNSKAKYHINVKVEWFWHGTNDIVNGNFIQVVKDLDQKDDGEAWMARDGGDWSAFWWFRNTTVKKTQDDSEGVKFSANSSKSLDDDDSLYKGGVYALRTSGSGWGTFYGANCDSQVAFVPYKYSSELSKKAEYSGELAPGSDVNWKISDRMPELYKDVMSTYSHWSVEDNLDDRLEYTGIEAWVKVNNVWQNVTSWAGNAEIKGQKVTWNWNAAFLGNTTYYHSNEFYVLVHTKIRGIGCISNSPIRNVINARTLPNKDIPNIPVPATINYYRDYNAGDTTPCFIDKTADTSNAYQVNSKADAAAKRADCSGLDGWYTDPECTKKYDDSWVPSNSDYVLNLYSKNKVTLSYAATSDSWFNKHPGRSVFADKGLSDKLTDRAGGKTASGASIFPAAKEAYYGDTVGVASGKSLWFESKLFGSGEKATRELKCSDGIYAYQDGSGDLLKEVRLTCDSTAYLKWLAGSYDGVYAGN